MAVREQETVVAFDIETVADTDLMRKSYKMPDAGDDEIVEKAKKQQLEKSDGRSDFLPLVFHKIAVVSAVIRRKDELHIVSKGPPGLNEKEAVESFYSWVDRASPVLVSWNGSGFDLPVIALRAMLHGVISEGYWQGPGDKWNQYTSRFHGAHQDLMDILAHYQGFRGSKLEDVALLCGLPGKLGYDGSQVQQMFNDKRYADISSYCEIDALNTYLLWLRYRMISGRLLVDRYKQECTLVENFLASSNAPHLDKFLASWVESR